MDLSHLNPEQKRAVLTVQGAVLVLAGAGTGKTTVITNRIVNLLEQGATPDQILAVTFTNKAAREMAERIQKLLPHVNVKKMTVSTFHSFACQILRKHARKLGYDARFGIADDQDREGVLKQALGEMGLTDDDNGYSWYASGIANAKNDLKSPDELRAKSRISMIKKLADVYEKYQSLLHGMNLMDFDDILVLTVRLFEDHPDVLAEYTERYHYLLVDEYQDTNVVQAEMIRLLAGERKNVCVVGDDDQSIYSWRGAHVGNILNFDKQYPGAAIIKLEQNYRSTGSILTVANHVIRHNMQRHDKALWSSKDAGDHIRLMTAKDEVEESSMVAQLLAHHHFGLGRPYEDMAVLVRSNRQVGDLERACRSQSVPYRVVGAKSFIERREIKDAIAYLRIAHNPKNDVSLRRIINTPARGFGAKTLEHMQAARDRLRKPLTQVLRDRDFRMVLNDSSRDELTRFVTAYDQAMLEFDEPGNLQGKITRYLEAVGYLSGLGKIYKNHDEATRRHEEVTGFCEWAGKWEENFEDGEPNLQNFLERNSLADDSDRTKDKTQEGEGVTLLTVHAAKGLEYPLVVVVGMEQQLFPHERALKEGGIDEERRLFYVAVTRAKEDLFLTRCLRRLKGKDARALRRPSQFLEELPLEQIRKERLEDVIKPASENDVDSHFANLRALLDD